MCHKLVTHTSNMCITKHDSDKVYLFWTVISDLSYLIWGGDNNYQGTQVKVIFLSDPVHTGTMFYLLLLLHFKYDMRASASLVFCFWMSSIDFQFTAKSRATVMGWTEHSTFYVVVDFVFSHELRFISSYFILTGV